MNFSSFSDVFFKSPQKASRKKKNLENNPPKRCFPLAILRRIWYNSKYKRPLFLPERSLP